MSLIQFTNDLNCNNATTATKFAAFQTFYTYFDQLKLAVLSTQTYTDKQLSEHIFKRQWKDNQAEMIFKKHLFAAHNTLTRLSTKITVANFTDYEFLLKMLAYDLYSIVAYAESNYRNVTLNYQMGSRPDQSAREIYDISSTLFYIGSINPANFYLREIIPVSIFLIRQTIEVYGKRLLGYTSITDEQGNRVRSVSTQVAWDFIKNEMKKTTPRITLPTHIDIIKVTEEWTNYYVHTGNIPDIYLIENALHFIEPLIYPQNGTNRNYKNSIRFAGTSSIDSYESLKTDFVDFINVQPNMNWWKKLILWFKIKLGIKKVPSRKVVNWYHVDSVDATIRTL
ncbi:MAG: hypothetical protein LC109_05975 [Bacteroidia bacterium]|nr:hypothetical protein [Bacteroidia bacterium]